MSRTTLIGALALSAIAVLGVPAAAAPTVAAAASRTPVLVSIAAPAEVERGASAAVGVTVRDFQSQASVPGTLVILLRRAAGEGDWAEVDRGVTDTEGRVALTAAVKPPSTDFKARVPATDTHRRGRSAVVTVVVN